MKKFPNVGKMLKSQIGSGWGPVLYENTDQHFSSNSKIQKWRHQKMWRHLVPDGLRSGQGGVRFFMKTRINIFQEIQKNENDVLKKCDVKWLDFGANADPWWARVFVKTRTAHGPKVATSFSSNFGRLVRVRSVWPNRVFLKTRIAHRPKVRIARVASCKIGLS